MNLDNLTAEMIERLAIENKERRAAMRWKNTSFLIAAAFAFIAPIAVLYFGA